MNTQKGLFGIFGIWLTMAMMPIAELLPLSPYQLLILRGAPAAFFFFMIGMQSKEERVKIPDRYTLATSIMFVLACIGLFNAIKAWGTNLSAILLDMAVLVNFIFALTRGERITGINFSCFAVAIVGSFLALRGWDTVNLNMEGLLWSLLAMTANGLFIEWNAKAEQSVSTKIFWWGTSLTLCGVLFSENIHSSWNVTTILLAMWFGVATGLLNFLCAITAFTNLKSVLVGTLVLGVTPSILIGSYFITGKTLAPDQLFGIALTLVAVGSLGYTLQKKH